MPTRRKFLKNTGAALGYSALLRSGLPLFAQPSTAVSADFSGTGSLAVHAARTHLPYGCAVDPERLYVEEAYTTTIQQQCSILVAENAMKWAAIHPGVDTYNFAPADKLLAFAQANKMQLRGHNLCWHESLPPWFASTVNKNNARDILVRHIQTVAGRYAGKLHSWDVVNEAIRVRDGRSDGLRNSPWLQLIGPDYIDLAFHTARQTDPHALLTYNDYGIEYDAALEEKKRAAVLHMLRGMRKRKVPIDAVGVQSHLRAGSNNPIGPGMVQFMKEANKLGLQVFLTEMDVDDSRLTGNAEERQAAVAAVYRQYLDTMLQKPWVTAMLTWGITNRYTWLNHEHPRKDGGMAQPLPFDANYQPAKAFFAMRDDFDRRAVESRIASA